MRIVMKSPFEMNQPFGGASTAIGVIGRFTRRSGATALTVALTVAVGLAFTAATPTPANAVECLLDTTDNGTADDPGDTDGNATSDVSFATACGSGADANGNGATVFGFDAATAMGTTDGIAIGDSAISNGTGAIAIGGDVNDNTVGAFATGDHAIAIGSQALTDGDGAIAIGGDLDADGTGAQALSPGAIAIGVDAVSSSIGIGAGVVSTGGTSTAVGDGATATFAEATVFGNNTEALAVGAVAIGSDLDGSGTGTSARGIGSIAVGSDAFVSTGSDFGIAIGSDRDGAGSGAISSAPGAIAIGADAEASAADALALGADASAAFAGSTALGAGAVTTRANQVVLGTASETYTLPGLTSAASSAAQAGPISIVTTDADGNLAADGGALFSGISGLKRDVRDNKEGIAMAMALDAPYVPPTSTFAMSGRYGNFEGESAVSLSGAVRVSPAVQFDVGLAYGVSHSNIGGTVGVTVNW